MILCGLAVLNCICLWISFRKNPIPEHLEEDEEATQTESGEDDVNEKPVSPKRGLFAQAIRLKFTWIAALFLLFYVGVETTIGGWGYTFLTVARNGNAVTMGQVSTTSIWSKRHSALRCPVYSLTIPNVFIITFRLCQAIG
jgi:hypothetical protein